MKLLVRLEQFTRVTGIFCISLLFVLMILQVFMRYGFGYSHFITEELGRYLLIWATMAGMALECRQGGHIRVAFLADKLPARLRTSWALLLNILVLLLFLVIIYTGLSSMVFNHGQESPGLQIPLSWPFAAIPVFFAIAFVFLLEKTLKKTADKKTK